MSETILSVSEITKRIQQRIESEPSFSDVCVRGEISNYKEYPPGNRFFSLKDGESVLRGVMFKREAMRLKFNPENGMKVLVYGRINVYPRDGQYRIIAQRMTPDGVGELYVAFEQLKRKLGAMGYFEPGRKRPLPRYPQRICIITSPAGAAIRDMLRILKKRWPLAEVNLLPVRVQGAEAPGEIAAAIEYACRHGLGEFIITGRGGGSAEDLWAFNDERVARAIYESTLPVVSAVGHEPDFTISDFVADLRAATPSNAAELCVPDQEELARRLAKLDASMRSAVTGTLRLARRRFMSVASRPVMTSPEVYVRERRQRLAAAEALMSSSIERALAAGKANVARIAASLDALSPLRVLARGYAVATAEDGKVIRSPADTEPGARLMLRLAEGSLNVRVEDTSDASDTDEPIPEQLELR